MDAFCLHSFPDLQQIWTILTSEGSAATSLRHAGKYYRAFVANVVLFLAMKEFWKSALVWQS